jgi:GR25 family glycosyltransferase involved in LPS biosynthesis
MNYKVSRLTQVYYIRTHMYIGSNIDQYADKLRKYGFENVNFVQEEAKVCALAIDTNVLTDQEIQASSHLNVYKMMIDNGIDHALVFDDRCKLLADNGEFWSMIEFPSRQLPANTDIFIYCGLHHEHYMVSEGILRILFFSQLPFYLVTIAGARAILNKIKTPCNELYSELSIMCHNDDINIYGSHSNQYNDFVPNDVSNGSDLHTKIHMNDHASKQLMECGNKVDRARNINICGKSTCGRNICSDLFQGPIPIEKFDWITYINTYANLKGLSTREQAYNHWVNYGQMEGRIPFIFNWEFYIKHYDYLRNLKRSEAYDYWIKYGENYDMLPDIPEFNNASILKDNFTIDKFDWVSYVNAYSDLQGMNICTQWEAYDHWLKHGKRQGRLIFKFDWLLYLKSNPNLIKGGINTKMLAYNHWIGSSYHTLCSEDTIACRSPRSSNGCCLTNMLEILESCQELFSAGCIPFFMAFETLYSSIEENSVDIEHNDIKMMSFTSYRQKVISYKDKLNELSYFLVEEANGDVNILYSHINFNRVNITFIDDGNNMSSEYKLNANGCTLYVPYEVILPLKSAKLYDIGVSIPHNARKFIQIIYANKLPKITSPASTLDTKTINQGSQANNYNIHCCYVINDHKRHDRLHNTISECNKYNLYVKKINAIMGKTLSKQKLIESGLLCKDSNLRMNEIAVYLSHVKVWSEIATLPESELWCLVLEDDIKIRESFDIMRDIRGTLQNIEWDIMFLGFKIMDNMCMEEVAKNVYITGLGWHLHAYIITPKTARKLLDDIFPIRNPIDYVITIPDKKYPTELTYDRRFEGKIKKVIICDHHRYIQCRDHMQLNIGIIDQTSNHFTSTTNMRNS